MTQDDATGTQSDDVTVLDVTGLQCPLPVLKAQKALKTLSVGAMLDVISTDPMAAIDIPHFCSEKGHILLAQEDVNGATRYRLKKA